MIGVCCVLNWNHAHNHLMLATEKDDVRKYINSTLGPTMIFQSCPSKSLRVFRLFLWVTLIVKNGQISPATLFYNIIFRFIRKNWWNLFSFKFCWLDSALSAFRYKSKSSRSRIEKKTQAVTGKWHTIRICTVVLLVHIIIGFSYRISYLIR